MADVATNARRTTVMPCRVTLGRWQTYS